MTSSTDTKLYGRGLVRELKPSLGPLRERFKHPPFSVLNAAESFWQDRKRRWLSLGIRSEEGRKKMLTYHVLDHFSNGQKRNVPKIQTSVFDPVLCELAYYWWCLPGGVVLDPFAGGSVRGVGASVLGYKYWGIDINESQISANLAQMNECNTGCYRPKWVCGDSVDEVYNAPTADFILSCPPYGNLERYSSDERDISTMPYQRFLVPYREIIKRTCDRLRDDRFACFVVASFREKGGDGRIMDLVGDTVRAFEAAGLGFYNDLVLLTALSTAALRATFIFVTGDRKVCKVHQNVLVFVKGDPKKAAAIVGGV